MLSEKFDNFLRDEQGGYTVWSLVWFMLFVGIGGLAVDFTDGYRTQSLLQASSDSGALAGVMSPLRDEPEVDNQAIAYASSNMPNGVHGTILTVDDVDIGTWDFATETFTAGGAAPNAVHVTTRRDATNSNPLATNFLRIIGLRELDVIADSIAIKGISQCHNGGLIAGREVSQATKNGFYENICVHGVEGMLVRNDNYFETGVQVSTTCEDCLGPQDLESTITSNTGFAEAWDLGGEGYELQPENAYIADQIINTLKALPDVASYDDMLATYGDEYAPWSYLFNGSTPPARVTGSTLPTTLTPFTVYEITCSGNLTLPETPIRNVAIVSDCPIHDTPSGILDIQNAVLAVDQLQQINNHGISIAASGDIGQADCSAGLEIYTNGTSVSFAAKGDVNNVRIVSAGDVDWAASANARVGISVEALRDIKITTDSDFGLCPDGSGPPGPRQFEYALVR